MKITEIFHAPSAQVYNQETAVEVAKEHCFANCSFMYNSTSSHDYWGINWIFKGFRNSQPHPYTFLTLGGDMTGRESANTENYYTLLMDNMPEWKEYPKRSESYICSTSISYTQDYGALYLMIPFDNAVIGKARASDVWFSFPYMAKQIGIESMANFTQYLNTTIEYMYGETLRRPEAKTYSELKKRIDATTKVLQKKYRYDSNPLLVFANYAINNFNGDLMKALENLMNPELNKFKLGLMPQVLSSVLSNPREVWFSGKCIALSLPEDYTTNPVYLFLEKVLKD